VSCSCTSECIFFDNLVKPCVLYSGSLTAADHAWASIPFSCMYFVGHLSLLATTSFRGPVYSRLGPGMAL
jgi:hypothetical protein